MVTVPTQASTGILSRRLLKQYNRSRGWWRVATYSTHDWDQSFVDLSANPGLLLGSPVGSFIPGGKSLHGFIFVYSITHGVLNMSVADGLCRLDVTCFSDMDMLLEMKG